MSLNTSPTMQRDRWKQDGRGLVLAWGALGAAMVALAVALMLASPGFGYAHQVTDMPVVALVVGLVSAGLLFLVLPVLIPVTVRRARTPMILAGVLVAGLIMRLVLMASQPVLEAIGSTHLPGVAKTLLDAASIAKLRKWAK